MALSPTQAANTPSVSSTTDIANPKTAGEAARSTIALKLIKQGFMPGTPEFSQAYQNALTGQAQEGGGVYTSFGNSHIDARMADTLISGGNSNSALLKMFMAATGAR